MNTCLNFNVFHPHCPARTFFDKFADKWVLLIIYQLKQESQYFNELKKNLDGISPKVLSQKLKMLERDGFISRKIHENTVIRVEYTLTTLGHEFAQTTICIKQWAENNIQHVLDAQQQFEALNSA